jgi:DNA repair exonuclease SbcCD ATPase subunit
MDAINADHALYAVFIALLLFLSIVYIQWSSSRRNAALLQQLCKRLEHVPDRLVSVQERQQVSTRDVTRVQEHLKRVEERLDKLQLNRNKENAKRRPPPSAEPDIVKTIDLLSNRIYALSRTNAQDGPPRSSFPAREIARLESQIEQQKTLHARALARAEEAKDFAEQQLQKHIHGAVERDAGTDGKTDSPLSVEFKLKVAEKEHNLLQRIEEAKGDITRANNEISNLQAEKLKSDEAVAALEKMHDAEVAQLEDDLKRAATRRASSSHHELRANQLQAELDDLKSDHQDEVVALKKTTETLTAELVLRL